MRLEEIRPEVWEMGRKAQERCSARFQEIDSVAEINTMRVMSAFQKNRVSEACFSGTNGYGYDDLGRETLDRIFADVFHTESALVRIGFVNGTHALASALFACVDPGDTLLSVTGSPYDTLQEVIGNKGDRFGTLSYYGVHYEQTELSPDGHPDIDAIRNAVSKENVRAVLIQRSRGYSERNALSVEEIGEICKQIRSVNPTVNILVDNCYGEFTETREPSQVGADLIAGSLIKNPGGGLAPTGGYIAGRSDLVERAASRLTTPGIGGECGSTLGNNRLLYQGLFLAPHTVAQAMKTAVFCSAMMEQLGLQSFPAVDEPRSDIIQTIILGSEDAMRRFCRGIQAGSPVDSFVSPEPWPMPGYDCNVIMAAGAFVQGSSIELSADGPIREPYAVYLQGGLTYESGKLGILMAVNEMMR